MKVEVKSYRTCAGRNGPDAAFSCTLWIDGKKVAEVTNSGSGGCNSYFWKDPSKEAAFSEWCRERYPEEEFEVEDHAIAVLLDELETEKMLKRTCRTKTVVRLRGEEDFLVDKAKWKGNEDRMRAMLRSKHGDQIEEIVNERYA